MGARFDKAKLISDPLRREAEQKWADSDRTAAKRSRQGRAKARAHARRQETARAVKEQVQETERLKGKLERTERELAHQRRRRGKDKSK
jgi:hypothetical protein